MQKVVLVLGIVAVGIASLALAAYLGLVRPGMQLDTASRVYVDQSVHAIAASWDEKELRSRASEEFMKVTNEQQLSQLFRAFRKLGGLTEYKGAKGQAGIFVTPQAGKVVTGQYVAEADFQNGKAQILVSILRKGDEWKIAGFRVNSPLFLEQMAR